MTTVLDTKLRPKVVSILAKYGQTMTLTYQHLTALSNITGGPVSTATPTTPATVLGSPLQVVLHPLVSGETQVNAGDSMTVIADQGLTVKPSKGDYLDVDGLRWTVIALDKLYSGDLVAAHQLYLRK